MDFGKVESNLNVSRWLNVSVDSKGRVAVADEAALDRAAVAAVLSTNAELVTGLKE